MPVPFGFGIGDFLTISRLIYQIGLELKKNPKSAPDYQLLLVELESLDRTLKSLKCMKPAQNEARRLDAIRALASTCQRPLEEFLAKIEKFDDSFGLCNSSSNSFSRLTRRLQWLMKYEEEVKSLRARLAPNIATITILLVTQTMDRLSTSESDHVQTARELSCKLFSQSKSLTDVKQIISNVEIAQNRLETRHSNLVAAAENQYQNLRALTSIADKVLKGSAAHEQDLHNQATILNKVQENGIIIDSRTQDINALSISIREDTAEIKAVIPSILERALAISNAVTTGITKVQDITVLISQMIRLNTHFTVEMRVTMTRLTKAFWDIQKQLARLESFMPKQIELPFVRFRDAFNEMRSFPYDLCRHWETFQGLVAVIFATRQGLRRVNMGQYFVTNVRIGRKVDPTFWNNALEPGDELSMTMILDDIEAEDGFCPYQSCGVSTKDIAPRQGRKLCSNCFRFAAISQKEDSPSKTCYEHKPSCSIHGFSTTELNPSSFPNGSAAISGPAPQPGILETEDIELYHSIQVAQALSVTKTYLPDGWTAVVQCNISLASWEEKHACIFQSSYGFFRRELHGAQNAHIGQVPKVDHTDGLGYIDTIDWIIKKGDTLVSELVTECPVEYTFPLNKKKLIDAEFLYVSDHYQDSHYPYHPKIHGPSLVGCLELDMTFLKETGQIKPQRTENGRFPYWKIAATLRTTIRGSKLTYEVLLNRHQSVG